MLMGERGIQVAGSSTTVGQIGGLAVSTAVQALAVLLVLLSLPDSAAGQSSFPWQEQQVKQAQAMQKALSVVNISSDNTGGPRPSTGGGGGAGWLTPVTPQLVPAFPGRPALKPADFGLSAGAGKSGQASTKPGGILLRNTMGLAMVDLLGVPYLHEGRKAGEGLDTVGVILNVYKKVWIDLPDSEEGMASVGKQIDKDAVTEGRLLTGDIAFVAALDRATESVRLRPLLVVWPGVVMLSTRSTGKVTWARLDQFAAGLRMVRRVIPAEGPISRQTEDKFSPYMAGSASRALPPQQVQAWGPSQNVFTARYLDEDDPDLLERKFRSGKYSTVSQAQASIQRENRRREYIAEGLQKRREDFYKDSSSAARNPYDVEMLLYGPPPDLPQGDWHLGGERRSRATPTAATEGGERIYSRSRAGSR
jgi:cell wall-associated NlpC family hydrolase